MNPRPKFLFKKGYNVLKGVITKKWTLFQIPLLGRSIHLQSESMRQY